MIHYKAAYISEPKDADLDRVSAFHRVDWIPCTSLPDAIALPLFVIALACVTRMKCREVI